MPLDEELRVGNAILDSDHEILFGLVDNIGSAAKTSNPAALDLAFKRLRHSMERHFQNEELFAYALGIPFNEHRLDHQNLLACVDCFRREFTGKEGELDSFCATCAQYLRDCLVRHLSEKDLSMKPMMQTRPPHFKVNGVCGGGGGERRLPEG
jgi:hemerythrin-like metal-binding protein